MSKSSKIIACAVLAVGLALAMPGAAQAQHHHGGWHGGWHGGGHYHGGWGWGPGFALGFGLGYGGPYYGGYYAPPPRCGWVRTRYWRYGRWYWRRVWRCW